MSILLSIFTSPIVFFGLGWIVSSIYFSINPIDDDTLIKEIINASFCIYACVAAVFNFFMGAYSANNDTEESISFWIGVGLPALAWACCTKILPYSEGATAIFYILCLGSMLYFGYKGWNKILS